RGKQSAHSVGKRKSSGGGRIMNTRRHTILIGWACMALAFADLLGIHAHQGQPEAAILLCPLIGAVLVAITAAKRARYLV
ncbi:MAG: hypothetical protein EBR81_01025, partial [Proteobacteria bacterium]|nr:hypothetical protein [Pseudomonadota bacterium]